MTGYGYLVSGGLGVPLINAAYVPAVAITAYGSSDNGSTDNTSAINQAYNALPPTGGTILIPDGGTYVISGNLVFTKPIRLQIGRCAISATGTGSLIVTNSNIRISGLNYQESQINLSAGMTGLSFASPWNPVDVGFSNAWGASVVVEDVTFFGGSKHIDTTTNPINLSAFCHITRCLFRAASTLAVKIATSVYYVFIDKCHYYNNQRSLYINQATETKTEHNIYEMPANGNVSVELAGVAHVTMIEDEFLSYVGVTDPDILIYAVADGADGIVDIERCKFGPEAEYWFNASNRRIKILSTASPPATTFSVRLTKNRFYGPNGLFATNIARTSNVALLTGIVFVNGNDSGIQIGDQIFLLGDATKGSFQGGPFTVTNRTANSLTWASTGVDVATTPYGGLVYGLSHCAISHGSSVDRFVYDGNYFEYPCAVDDTADTNANIFDRSGRCVWTDSNQICMVHGIQQEFKRGGRQFATMKPGPDSPLASYDAQARVNETPELRNRVKVESEGLSHWANTGSMSVTPGQADPFGTARATLLARPGTAPLAFSLNGSNLITSAEAIQSDVNIASPVPVHGFLSFWAKTGGSNPCGTMMAVITNNGNANAMLIEQISLSSTWKRYRLPFSYDPDMISTVTVYLTPGMNYAMKTSCVVFGIQVDDYGGDYIPVTYTGSDASVVDTTAGNRYERRLNVAASLSGFTTIASGVTTSATIGKIGATGPATAGQNSWIQMFDSTNQTFFVPIWK